MPLLISNQIPQDLPAEMERTVSLLKRCPGQLACLKRAYELMTAKYRGQRLKTYLYLPQVFSRDLNKLWTKQGFLHCSNLNYLLKILLVASGWFKPEDIIVKWTLIWYLSPHQYLAVKTADQLIYIDLWGASQGIEFGDYSHGFH